jgi:hypothetical protein
MPTVGWPLVNIQRMCCANSWRSSLGWHRLALGSKPPGLFDDYQQEAFERLLAEQFLVHEQQRLPNGTRTLYLAEPKP